MKTCIIDTILDLDSLFLRIWKEKLFTGCDLLCYVTRKCPEVLGTVFENDDVVEVNLLNMNNESNPNVWLKRLMNDLKERYYHPVKQLSFFDDMLEVHEIKERQKRR